jgi:mannose-6-phosphate isomerase-like protein (cupin superfamily)
MPVPFTVKSLTDVAAHAGLPPTQQTRFAAQDLEAERTGVTLHRFAAGSRQAFGHRHEADEEVYVVVSGAGRMKLGETVVDVAPLDAIRVAPQVIRAFEAGPDGLEVLAVGARHEGDGEIVPGWWTD